jgi:hypothetical protein
MNKLFAPLLLLLVLSSISWAAPKRDPHDNIRKYEQSTCADSFVRNNCATNVPEGGAGLSYILVSFGLLGAAMFSRHKRRT